MRIGILGGGVIARLLLDEIRAGKEKAIRLKPDSTKPARRTRTAAGARKTGKRRARS